MEALGQRLLSTAAHQLIHVLSYWQSSAAAACTAETSTLVS